MRASSSANTNNIGRRIILFLLLFGHKGIFAGTEIYRGETMNSNSSFSAFRRKQGPKIIGGLMAAGLIALGVIGYKTNTISDIYARLAPREDTASQAPDNNAEIYKNDPDALWKAALGINDLNLKYPVRIISIDGEMFDYSVEFNRDVTEEDKKNIIAEITKKCGQQVDDNYYGDYFLLDGRNSRYLRIILDLGNSYTDKAVTGILRALNEIDGVSSVTINEAYQLPANTAPAETKAAAGNDNTAGQLAANSSSMKEHYEKLGTYFPIEFDSVGEQFLIKLTFTGDLTDEQRGAVEETLKPVFEKSKVTYTFARGSAKELAFSCDTSATSIIAQDMNFVPDEIFKALSGKIKGIEKAAIQAVE